MGLPKLGLPKRESSPVFGAIVVGGFTSDHALPESGSIDLVLGAGAGAAPAGGIEPLPESGSTSGLTLGVDEPLSSALLVLYCLPCQVNVPPAPCSARADAKASRKLPASGLFLE